MALEQVFECPRTLRKLRSRPLGELLDGFCQWLLERRFSRGSIRTILGNLSHLNRHLGGVPTPPHSGVMAADIAGFFKVYPLRCRHRGPLEGHLRRVRYSVHRFVAYLREERRFDPCVTPPIYQPLRDTYLEWMRQRQHAADGTLAVRAHSIELFLQWLGPQATATGLSELTAERVEQFFISYAQNAGRAARHSMQSALRTFLRFGLHAGWIRGRLDLAVPTLRTYKLSTVPRGLSEGQACQVLAVVDRSHPAGRRDYAMLQLLHTYGVRGGQVRALRLTDIQWAQDRILFRAAKHGKDSLLPLTSEVGASLLDYLQNGRPYGCWPEVFLTCRPPYHPLPASSSLSEVVHRHIRAAGLQVRCQGSHAFRHGFATRMVAQGHSLKAVADVLGHRYLSTTFLYTKVDFNALNQVALDWPEEVNP
jgi:integrase/recombinase XerD